MPTLSIITAVLDGYHQHLPETYESLRGQVMPDGWDWQWIVQEDGQTGRPLTLLPADSRISPDTGPRGRAATARTLALSRAEGILVRALDADDLLTEGALIRDISTLTEHPDIAWCLSPTLDLLPDGVLAPGRSPAPAGSVPAHHFMNASEHEDLLAIAGTALCAYTELVRAVGGWPAIPANDDVGLLLAVDAVSDGWMIDQPSLLYRRWHGNTTAAHEPGAEARRVAILDHACALRRTGWKWSPRPNSEYRPSNQ